MREKAKLYHESPAVLNLEKAKIEAAAFAGTQIMPTEIASNVFTNPALQFFASLSGTKRNQPSPSVTPVVESNTGEKKTLTQ
jgi:hypothetical protein